VIVAEQMQQAVQRQHAQFGAERMPGGRCLAAGDADRDDHVTQRTGFVSREGQHVGRRILLSITPIERAHARVLHERDGHRAARARGGDGLQPGPEARGPRTGSADDLDEQRRVAPFTHPSNGDPSRHRTP
jgi:hypothetical protein